jgi:hypothetical protein
MNEVTRRGLIFGAATVLRRMDRWWAWNACAWQLSPMMLSGRVRGGLLLHVSQDFRVVIDRNAINLPLNG